MEEKCDSPTISFAFKTTADDYPFTEEYKGGYTCKCDIMGSIDSDIIL